MDSSIEEETNSGDSEKRRERRRGWAIFSCFAGSSVSHRRKRRTVPIENAGDANSGARERAKQSFLEKFRKDKTKPQQAVSNTGPQVRHVSSQLNTRTEPAPLYRMLDPVRTRTQTRTSHSGSPEPGTRPTTASKECEKKSTQLYGPSNGLTVLTVALATMVLGGLAWSTVCMLAWFCLLHVVRPDPVQPDQVLVQDGDKNKGEKGVDQVDFDSEEYKKMVVLKGFLERDKRK